MSSRSRTPITIGAAVVIAPAPTPAADDVRIAPLADATAIVQKLRATQPDIVFYDATNFPDSIQVLQKVQSRSSRRSIASGASAG